jgi:hypothetical protein
MKILVQWTTSDLRDWEEIDSSSWADLPFRPDPTGTPISAGVNNQKGWINALNVQGVIFTNDHYSVEDIPDGGVRVTGWNDDPVLWGNERQRATVWEFLPLAPDPGMGGAINTRQKAKNYWASNIAIESRIGFDNDHENRWEDFTPPARKFIRHGKWVSKEHHDLLTKHQTTRGWMEWASAGQDVFNQRARGLYNKPKGTRTWFIQNLPGSTVHSADFASAGAESGILFVDSGVGTSATITFNNLFGGGEATFVFGCITPTAPGDNPWPAGDYRLQLRITTAGTDVDYGLTSAAGVSGHVAAVLPNGTNHNANAGQFSTVSSLSALESGTGLKLFVATTASSPSVQTDRRFAVVLGGWRPANHGNQNFAYQVGDSDSFIDAPFAEEEGVIAQFSSLSAVAGLSAGHIPYPGPYFLSGKLYGVFAPVSDNSAVNMIFGVSADALSGADRDKWSNTTTNGINLSSPVIDYDSILDNTREVIHVVTVTSLGDYRYHQFRTSNDSWAISNTEIVSAGSFAGGGAAEFQAVTITQRTDGDLMVLCLGSGSSGVDRNWLYIATNEQTPTFTSLGQIYNLGTVGERHAVLTPPNAADTVAALFVHFSGVPSLFGLGITSNNTIGTAVDLHGDAEGGLSTDRPNLARVKGELASGGLAPFSIKGAAGQNTVHGLLEVSDVVSLAASSFRTVVVDGRPMNTFVFSNNTGFIGDRRDSDAEHFTFGTTDIAPANWLSGPLPDFQLVDNTAATTQNRWDFTVLSMAGTSFAPTAEGYRHAIQIRRFNNYADVDVTFHAFEITASATPDPAEARWLIVPPSIDVGAGDTTVDPAPAEARWLTVAPTIDIGEYDVEPEPVEARWLAVSPTIDIGEYGVEPEPVEARWLVPGNTTTDVGAVTAGLGTVTPAVEAQWLTITPTIDNAELAQFSGLSAMRITSDPGLANFTHRAYGGPYLYSGQMYTMGTDKTIAENFNIVRTISAPITDRDHWSATWEGIHHPNDVVAYDSIQFNNSVIGVVVQVSLGDLTYNEFHLSNNTWSISNQPVFSVAAPVSSNTVHSPQIQIRNNGDKVIAATFTNTTSSIADNFMWVQSGDTVWTAQYPGVGFMPSAPGSRHPYGVTLCPPDATGNIYAIAGGNNLGVWTAEFDTSSNFNSYTSFPLTPTAELIDTTAGVGYVKGDMFSNTINVVYPGLAGEPIGAFVVAGDPFTLYDSGEAIDPFTNGDMVGDTVLTPGGTVHVSEIVTAVWINGDGSSSFGTVQTIYNDRQSGYPYVNAFSSHIFKNSSFTVQNIHHNVLSLTGTSYGSGLEIVALYNDAHSSLDIFVKQIDVDTTVNITTQPEARWLTVAPTIDKGEAKPDKGTGIIPAPARWLAVSPTIDIGEYDVEPEPVEARWLVVAPTANLTAGEVGRFESLSNVEIAASAASMAHIYGGPYFYSGQAYIFGMGKNSNDIINVVRTVSAPLTTRDNWSATWDGIALVDDCRAFDSILYRTSIIAVATQVSQSDTTYHEFHLSNNTWGISNQAVASGGVGGITSAAALGVGITARADGDKIIGAIYTHTTSSLDQQMLYIQSATTAWTSQGPINPRQDGAHPAQGLVFTSVNDEDETLALTIDTSEDIEIVHIGADSALASNWLFNGAAAVNVKSITYSKGRDDNGNIFFGWYPGSPTLRMEKVDISTAPTQIASSTRVATVNGDDAGSGFFGGTIQTSEIVTALYVTVTNNANNGIRSTFYGQGSASLWSHMATGIPATGAVQHLFHNHLDFSSDVGVTSFGSGLEAVIVWNDNHSSIDVVALGLEVDQEVTVTLPAEARWLTISPTIDIGEYDVEPEPVEARWLAVSPTIDIGEYDVEPEPVEARWLVNTPTINQGRTVNPQPVEARWLVPAANTIRTVTPVPAEARWLTISPTIDIGSYDVETQPAEARWLAVAPTLDHDREVQAAPAEARWLTVSPTIDIGEYDVETQPAEARWLIPAANTVRVVNPTPVEARWLIVSPTIDIGGIEIEPEPAESRWLVPAANTIRVANPAPVEARWLVVAPSIVEGGASQTVNPSPVEARWLTVSPTIDVGEYDVEPEPVEARWLAISPSIDHNFELQATPVEARWLTVAPTIDIGEYDVEPEPVEARWLTVSPSIDIGEYDVETQPVEARWLIPPANTVRVANPAPAEARWITVSPTIDVGSVSTSTQPVEARWSVPTPSIVVTVNPDSVEAQWLVSGNVTIDVGETIIDPTPVEARWLALGVVVTLGVGIDQDVSPSPVEARWLVPTPSIELIRKIKLPTITLSVATSGHAIALSSPTSSPVEALSVATSSLGLTIRLRGT